MITNENLLDQYLIDHPECEVCGNIQNVSVHHMIPRGWFRADVSENLVSLCLSHHEDAHKDVREFADSFLENFRNTFKNHLELFKHLEDNYGRFSEGEPQVPVSIKNSDSAFNNEENIKKWVFGGRAAKYALGYYLLENRENKYWDELGYDSFEAFIAQPEIKIKRATAYNFINAFRVSQAILELAEDRPNFRQNEVSEIINEKVEPYLWTVISGQIGEIPGEDSTEEEKEKWLENAVDWTYKLADNSLSDIRELIKENGGKTTDVPPKSKALNALITFLREFVKPFYYPSLYGEDNVSVSYEKVVTLKNLFEEYERR
jgi:hypothetical protein